jgi:hypothetical protein
MPTFRSATWSLIAWPRQLNSCAIAGATRPRSAQVISEGAMGFHGLLGSAAKQSVSPKGMTAKVTSAGNIESIGARAWRSLSPFGGTKSSLKSILITSAPVWSRPARRSSKGPSGMREAA